VPFAAAILDQPGCRGYGRVLDLDPIRRAPGSIRPVPPLGDDALKPELAGVTEDDIAVGTVEMFR
jgi:hypothetical protein